MADLLSVRDYDRAIPPQQDRLGLGGSEASDNGLKSSTWCLYLTGQEQNQIQIKEKLILMATLMYISISVPVSGLFKNHYKLLNCSLED